ncbi:hypothetical protein, partial [uncultured Serratia sp.]|uniref:hypothetical protein n=1 Tax=uncultured Serratia sp. TaxID=239175 RepID=UPI002592ABF1
LCVLPGLIASSIAPEKICRYLNNTLLVPLKLIKRSGSHFPFAAMPDAFKLRLTLPRRCLSDVYQSLSIMSANKLITLILIHCFGSLAGRAGYTYHNLSIFCQNGSGGRVIP